MQPRPKDESLRWLLHAERDLGYARLGLARLGLEIGGFHAQTCFMVHQSMEKALKALLFLRGTRYVQEGPISDLLKRVSDVSPGLNRYEDIAGRIDQYYLACRFLGTLPGSDPVEVIDEPRAKEAVSEGENLLLEVRNIIRLGR